MKTRNLLSAFAVAAVLINASLAMSKTVVTSVQDPLHPIAPYIADRGIESVYPSVAGQFVVFGQRKGDDLSMFRVSKATPNSSRYQLKKLALHDSMRYGVAVDDGSIGYVSDRVGPISAWMWQGKGDGQVAIGGMATYRGTIAPFHLNASSDGKVWCFDTTFQKARYNQMLGEFTKYPHHQMVGQHWRSYDSDNFRYKHGYAGTKAGNTNKLDAPVLYIFSRKNSEVIMIPNAYDGAISPDGKRVAFVRQIDGNYDIWIQDIDGDNLMQMTSSPYGDFEPAWSPDGKRLTFVSNRDSAGTVTETSIYMLDVSSNRVSRLTNARAATDGGPAWLDNSSVLFHSNRVLSNPQGDTYSGWNIWKLDIK